MHSDDKSCQQYPYPAAQADFEYLAPRVSYELSDSISVPHRRKKRACITWDPCVGHVPVQACGQNAWAGHEEWDAIMSDLHPRPERRAGLASYRTKRCPCRTLAIGRPIWGWISLCILNLLYLQILSFDSFNLLASTSLLDRHPRRVLYAQRTLVYEPGYECYYMGLLFQSG